MKNKAPAEIQITAEQLLREAKERDLEIVPPVSIKTFGVLYCKLCLMKNVLVKIQYFVFSLLNKKSLIQ